MSYVKLDCGILDSSLWAEAAEVRLTFITILAMTGPDGVCLATAPGIARRANLPLEAVRHALTVLEGPDPDSRSVAEEGRRLVRVDGGYRVVNYLAYRDKDHTAAERVRRYRQRLAVTRNNRNATVTDRDDRNASRKQKQKQIEVPRASSRVVTWSVEAVDDWRARFQAEKAPAGQIGSSLQPLVRTHGWDVVRPAWQRYLAATEGKFASPTRFATTWGDWRPAPPPPKPAPEPTSPQFFERRA